MKRMLFSLPALCLLLLAPLALAQDSGLKPFKKRSFVLVVFQGCNVKVAKEISKHLKRTYKIKGVELVKTQPKPSMTNSVDKRREVLTELAEGLGVVADPKVSIRTLEKNVREALKKDGSKDAKAKLADLEISCQLRYSADELLKQVKTAAKKYENDEDFFGVIGVTDVDLIKSEKTVFSASDKGYAVVSYARMNDKKVTNTISHLKKVVTATSRSMVGLPECSQEKCPCAAAATVKALDKKRVTFCKGCREALKGLKAKK